jgi:hypothetical protein
MSRNTSILAMVILLCAASLFVLQSRFETSDHEKGQRLVRGFRAPGRDETFEAFLIRAHGGRAGEWSSEITGGCRGVMRVAFTLPGSPGTVHVWDLEIPSQAIHPRPDSPSGQKLLEEFTQPDRVLPALKLPPSDAGTRE